ncbi:MAG TPA: protein-L-isoaspartate O-methyltransferase [Bacteroidales bacterium]|nr:protein-L-isoaspartate O-methyltransferase [Bacteroidales bacterium]
MNYRVGLWVLSVLLAIPVGFASDPTEGFRRRMVETQIIQRGISHPATIRALKAVPRHKYVPPEQRRFAYADRPLPIGFGQTISQPYIVAFMTEIIDPKPHYRVLEIGTGSGYQAAILAEIVDRVYTIEIIPALGLRAGEVLDRYYDNVEVKIADGFYGWADAAPFDAIVVTAASGVIPPPLIEQLRDGGRMIIPVGSPYMVQQLMLVTKRGNRIETRNLMPVRFVPFTRN